METVGITHEARLEIKLVELVDDYVDKHGCEPDKILVPESIYDCAFSDQPEPFQATFRYIPIVRFGGKSITLACNAPEPKSIEKLMDKVELRCVHDGDTVYSLKDYFICEEAVDKDDLMNELLARLGHDQANTMVLLASVDENPVGILVAWAVHNRDYEWVDQCWYSPAIQGPVEGDKPARSVDGFIAMGANERGKCKIRMQTPRSTKAWARKWGFKEKLVVMEKGI